MSNNTKNIYPVESWHIFSKKFYKYSWYGSKWYRRNIFGLICQFFDDIKYSWQRIRYGYCDHDVWELYSWFLDIMPRMLEELKRTRHGSPVINKEDEGNDEALTKAWDEILDRMIFLMREVLEETCQKKNPYEDEYDKAHEEFEIKYGKFGEKLQTEEDKKMKNAIRAYFPSDVPEYKDISEKYSDEDKKLREYRRKCKDEALTLFSKYFYGLWD